MTRLLHRRRQDSPVPRRAASISAAAVLLLTGPAWADSFRTPRFQQGAPVSIAAYGRQNPACLEWTNGCVLCSRSDGQSRCSTPGIACLPAGITCKRLAR